MTGRLRIVETAPSVQLEPRSWHVIADGLYIGMIAKYGGPLGGIPAELLAPISFRAFGTEAILGLGDGPVDRELDFPTLDEAVAWLLDDGEEDDRPGPDWWAIP